VLPAKCINLSGVFALTLRMTQYSDPFLLFLACLRTSLCQVLPLRVSFSPHNFDLKWTRSRFFKPFSHTLSLLFNERPLSTFFRIPSKSVGTTNEVLKPRSGTSLPFSHTTRPLPPCSCESFPPPLVCSWFPFRCMVWLRGSLVCYISAPDEANLTPTSLPFNFSPHGKLGAYFFILSVIFAPKIPCLVTL